MQLFIIHLLDYGSPTICTFCFFLFSRRVSCFVLVEEEMGLVGSYYSEQQARVHGFLEWRLCMVPGP